MQNRFCLLFVALACAAPVCVAPVSAFAQDKAVKKDDAKGPVRGSLQEDLAARKLLEAGDARFAADETAKAVEVWQSVIERYPRSKIRYDAHLRLGDYLLDRERAYDRARSHYEAVAHEENRDDEQRALATLKMGVCFYEARNYGKCFSVMREVIEKFPVSPQVNQAYYYIGLGHFQLGHYSRAISALEKVGTALTNDEGKIEKVEAGKRLFVKIEDADLSALEADQTVKVECTATSGDKEILECIPVGRNVRVVLGSMLTSLGRAKPGNGRLEVKGDDKVTVTYVDTHTADKQFNRKVLRQIQVVGNALPEITDGAFSEKLRGVVLGRTINVQITDPDRDVSDKADKLQAAIELYREKTTAEIDAEVAEQKAKIAAGQAEADPDAPDGVKINRLKLIDKVDVALTEVKVNREIATQIQAANDPANEAPMPDGPNAATKAPAPATPAQPAAEPDDGTIHSGVFRAQVTILRADKIVAGDDTLQALPNDVVQVAYTDALHMGDGSRLVVARANSVEGNLGGVRVTRAEISDQELRVKTLLKTASALTNIGNRYKEFGLKKHADSKYEQALNVCEDILEDARRLGGRLLEETYVQLWQVYYEMDKLEMAANMSQRLQREFPNSEFVDDALLKLADVVRKQGDLNRAIGIYGRLVSTQGSQLRGEAQFGIAECYESMAKSSLDKGGAAQAQQLFDRSFQEYKKVFDQFPESGRVGEAVAKMANYYYQQKDYARAVDIFETVLNDHPDAKFLDVILFNYGRCLIRMDRKGDARKQFDQLIGDFPESPLAADAKKIVELLVQKGAG